MNVKKAIIFVMIQCFMFSGSLLGMEEEKIDFDDKALLKQEIYEEVKGPYSFEMPLWESPKTWNFLSRPIAETLNYSPKSDNPITYLGQLQILANLLLVSVDFQNFISNTMLPSTREISTVPVTQLYERYSLGMSQEEYLEHEAKIAEMGCAEVCNLGKNIITPEEKIHRLNSSEGKAVALQLAHLIYLPSGKRALPKDNEIFNALLASNHSEVVAVAGYIKNHILQDIQSDVLADLSSLFFNPVCIAKVAKKLDNWQFAQNEIRSSPRYNGEYTCALVAEEKIILLVQKWLKNNNCSCIEQYIPHTLWLYRFFNCIINNFEMATEEHARHILHDENSALENQFEKIEEQLIETNKRYESFYKKVIEEQKKVIQSLPKEKRIELIKNKKYRQIFFNAGKMYQPLPDVLISKETAHVQSQKDENDSFLPSYLKNVPKKQQNKLHQKKSKKGRSRPHRNNDEEPEHIQSTPVIKTSNTINFELKTDCFDTSYRFLPTYHKRVLDRFQKGHESYDLYHTFHPLVDIFVFSYGIPKKVKRQGEENTDYHMAGEIYHKKTNKKEQVLFTCVRSRHGICYHRGFEKKNSSLFKEFGSEEFIFKLSDADHGESDSKMRDMGFDKSSLRDIYPSTEYKENSLFIEIDDSRNDVQIILFKPRASWNKSMCNEA